MSSDCASFENTSFDTLLLQRVHERVIQVQLNRPRAHNAYNAQMVKELGQLLAYSERTPTIEVIILTGSGDKTFCAGACLNEAFVDAGRGLLNAQGGYNPLQFMPRRKVWIAALNGHAFGGGLELALQCDLIVAHHGVKLSLPETRHGLLPVGGGISRLTAQLPPAVVKEMILTGMALEAGRAAELGLINRLTAREQVLDEALALAQRVTLNAPLAVQACNALIEHSLHGEQATLEAHIQQELRDLQQSDDFAEGGRAFRERRPPVWQGK